MTLSDAERISFTAFGVPLDVEVPARLGARTHAILPPARSYGRSDGDRVAVSVEERDCDLIVVSQGQPVGSTRDDEFALGMLDAQIRAQIALLAPDHIFVHAGVVALGGRAVILPGSTFAGKTTLIGALVQAGATYYSDEFAVIDERGLVHPYPKPLSIRERDGSGRTRETPADELGGQIGRDPVPAGLIAVTSYEPAAELQPQPLPEGAALLALLEHTIPARTRPGQSIAALKAAVQGTRAWKSRRGEAAEAARAILAELSESGFSQGRAATLAGNLRVDARGAAVRGRLAAEGIECVLIKGRSFAQRLYDHPSERPYSDTDLLVSPRDFERAVRALRDLGYRRIDRDGDRLGAPGYAHTFQGPHGSLVDLHWNIAGVGAPASATWQAISEKTVSLTVGGRPARVPDDAAIAFLVTLHNAHHGARWSSTAPDLERAIDRLDKRDWVAAAALAERLRADVAFAAGLQLCPAAAAAAEQWGVVPGLSLEYRLRARETSYAAWALHRIVTAGSLKERALVACRVLVPEPATMRRWFPLAGRGPLGLLAAYLLRPLRLLSAAAPALSEYRRVRTQRST